MLVRKVYVPLTNKILAALHGRAAQMQESQRFLGFLAPNKHVCLSISFIHFFHPINGMHASSSSAVGLRPPFLPGLCSLERSHPDPRGATLPSTDVLSISRDTADRYAIKTEYMSCTLYRRVTRAATVQYPLEHLKRQPISK